MKCPICGREVELQKKQIGIDELGEPTYTQYAVCRSCKKQWNLDKQRAKKKAAQTKQFVTEASHKPARQETNTKKPEKKNSTAPAKKTDAKKAAEKKSSGEPRYTNIPSEKVMEKKKTAIKQGYEDMLSMDPKYKPKKKKAGKEESDLSDKNKKKGRAKPRFRIIRILLGILCIAASGYLLYLAFLAGLNTLAGAASHMKGIVCLVLSLCLLVTGLLTLLMQKLNTIFAYILPMLFCLLGAAFAFIKKGEDQTLLYGSIGAAGAALLFLLLGIASRAKNNDSNSFDEK